MASRGAALRCRRKAAGRCWSSRVLLWVGTLASSLLGTLSDQKGHPEWTTRKLDVTLRGSVLLSASVPSDQLVSTEWDFAPQAGQRVILVESSSGSSPRINSEHRLGPRVEVINMTCLRIWDLETGDGGIFQARVKFQGGGVEEYTFTLTLHEPVPSPRVSCSVTSHFPGGCNVTLYCESAGNGEFKTSWAEGELPQVLEEGGSNWYQLSDNGTALQLPWRFGSSPSSFTCLVSNAAEEKRASVGVASCCPQAGAKGTGPLRWPWYLLAIAVMIAVLLGLLWVWTERRKRTPRRGPSKTEQPCEAKYSELRPRARPPASGCGQPGSAPPEPRLKSQTIYAILQSESCLYDDGT